MTISSKLAASSLALVLLLGEVVFAQKPGVQRTIVTRADISTPGKEAIVAKIEFPVSASAGRHTHFGEEIGYVIEGEGELLIDGQPPRAIKAGDGFIVAAGAIHDARNTGSGLLRLSGVYVVEKGKLLSVPAN